MEDQAHGKGRLQDRGRGQARAALRNPQNSQTLNYNLPSEQEALLIVKATGVIFHRWETLRFQNAIWHGFVPVAAMLPLSGHSLLRLGRIHWSLIEERRSWHRGLN